MKILFALFGGSLAAFIFQAAALAQGFGAFPISQAVEVSAGRSTTLSFELLNFSAEPMELEVAHSYVPSRLTEEQVNSIGNSRLRQLMIDRPRDHGTWMVIPEVITLEGAGAGGPNILEIPIDVPPSASGTITGTIIFTQKTDALLRLAYRCNYLLTVANRPLVREITLEKVEIEQVAGTTAFSAEVTNIGNTGFDIGGDYSLFRQVGPRKTPVLKDSIDTVSLQPGQPTTISSTFSDTLASGRYELRLAATLSGAPQRPRVIEFDFEGPFDAGSKIADTALFGSPNLALVSMAPRARRSIPYVIENPTTEPVTVALSLTDEPAKGLSFQIIPESLTISPASTGRFRVVAQAGADIDLPAPQTLDLLALATKQDGSSAKHLFKLWVTTPDEPATNGLRLNQATLDYDKGELRFDLTNTGNVPVSPLGLASVFVRADQPILSADFRVDALIPPGAEYPVVIALDDIQRETAADLRSLSSAIEVSLGLMIHHPDKGSPDQLVLALDRE